MGEGGKSDTEPAATVLGPHCELGECDCEGGEGGGELGTGLQQCVEWNKTA